MSTSSSPYELVLVLGMHRSGTSALTEAIGALGFQMTCGEHLMVEADTNERGHFEDQRVTELNDWILSRHGASWFNPWPIRGREPGAEELAAVAALWETLKSEGVTLLKDPRLSILWRWWAPAWGSDVALKLVEIIRHPSEVAMSLRSRDGFPLAYGEALWFHYVAATHAHTVTQGHPVILLDDLLRTPRSVLETLAAALTPQEGRDARVKHAATVIQPQLRHQRAPELPELSLVRELYQAFLDVESDPSRRRLSDLLSRSEEVNLEYLATAALMELRQRDMDLACLRDQRDQLATRVTELEASISWRVTAPLRVIGSLLSSTHQ